MFNLEKYKKFIFAILIIYWIIILVATSLPSEKVPSLNVGDKFQHFAAYFVLGVLLNITLMVQDKSKIFREKSHIFTFIIIFVYGIFDELHQSFIPGRFADILDLAADIIGGGLGILFVYILFNRKSKSFNN